MMVFAFRYMYCCILYIIYLNTTLCIILKNPYNSMPHLIKGKMRFTEQDNAMSEFNEKVQKQFGSITQDTLYAILNQQLVYQSLLKDHEITEKFDTRNNIKISLSNSLSVLSAIAKNEGYNLTELINSFIHENHNL